MARRLAAIMMADLAGYSSLMEADAPAAIARVRHMRERALEPIATAAGGVIEKRMGDGWLVTFSSAMMAVSAAQKIQNGLTDTDGLKLRLAVHLGEIVEEDGEIYGSGINISARLQAQAPPGGLIVSAECHRQLDPELAETFVDAGSYELKNVKTPVDCLQWRPTGMQTTTPSADALPVIAVTPFSAGPKTAEMIEAAADVQEQITHSLSQRTGLRVMQLDSDAEPRNDVTYLLRGRLRASGETAKAMLSLVRGDTSHVFWSETFEGSSDDLYVFSDHVSDMALNAIRVNINAFDAERLEHLDESAMTPSELRSRAAQYFHKGLVRDYRVAERLLQRALDLDPDHPISLSMMCLAKLWPPLAEFKPVPQHELDWCVAAADLAVRAAPRNYFMFFVRSHVRFAGQGDIESAKKDVQRALELNPGYVWGLETRALIQMIEAQDATAAETMQKVVDRSASDPLLARRYFWLAFAQTLGEDFKAASDNAEKALELLPDFAPYWRLLAHLREALNDTPAAEDAWARAKTLKDQPPNLYLFHIALPEKGARLLKLLHTG